MFATPIYPIILTDSSLIAKMIRSNQNHSSVLRKYKIFVIILLLLVSIIIIRTTLSLDYFPFKDLLVNEEYLSPNNRPVRNGALLKLRTLNVTILGMGRDIEESIPNVFDQMLTLGESFKDFQILFVEGNSKDKTLEKFT